MAHTPGPWKVNHLPWCIYVGHGVEDSVTGHSAESIAYNVTGDDNARLIAAAPDLLKACKAFMADIPELWGDLVVDGGTMTITISSDVVDAIEDAIAKAVPR